MSGWFQIYKAMRPKKQFIPATFYNTVKRLIAQLADYFLNQTAPVTEKKGGFVKHLA